MKRFLLADNDLRHFTYVLSENKKICYDTADVEQAVIRKYGSWEAMESFLQKRQQKHETVRKNRVRRHNERRRELIEAFQDNKFEFKKYGDCYSYIHYGTPNIEEILKKEHMSVQEKTGRKIKLAKELSLHNLSFDENLKACYNYINNLGSGDITDVVREVEIEEFLKKETDYLKFIKKYRPKKAREYAVRQYASQKDIKQTPVHEDFIVRFD